MAQRRMYDTTTSNERASKGSDLPSASLNDTLAIEVDRDIAFATKVAEGSTPMAVATRGHCASVSE